MKKNYFEPIIHVQTIALESMMAGSPFDDEMDIDPGTYSGGDAPVKEDFENFFD